MDDKIKSEETYNPLHKRNLGISIEKALLSRPIGPLKLSEKFLGAGVYVIYYAGDFPAYKFIADKNRNNKFEQPIYVGKAVPKGSRIGSDLSLEAGSVLHDRIDEHAESVIQAKNLKIGHFSCRYLLVDDIFIPLGESLLISTFNPIWNHPIGGFGNHDPGSGRYKQQKSAWDVVHPGRKWAERLQSNKRNAAEIFADLEKFKLKRGIS